MICTFKEKLKKNENNRIKKKLEYVTGYRENRQKYANEILDNPNNYPELIRLCFQVTDKNASKTFWILELIYYQKLEWIKTYLIFFVRISNILKI